MPRRTRRTIRQTIAAVAVGALAMTGAACVAQPGSADSAAFVRIVVPTDLLNPPSGMPVVLPSVACVRDVGGGVKEAVFGYEDTDTVTADAPLVGPPDNQLLRTRGGGTVVDAVQPQVTQFHPGSHPTEFAARFRPGDLLTWVFTTVGANHTPSGAQRTWTVSVTAKPDGPACGAEVPAHFAVVQRAAIVNDIDVQRDPAGVITGYGFRVGYDVTVACSEGSSGSSSESLVGFSSDNATVDPVLGTRQFVSPGGSITFLITTNHFFPVIDITRPAVVPWPSSDISARCEYPGGPAEARTYFSDYPGFVTTTHLKGQLEGTDTYCELPTTGCLPTDFIIDAVAPGGIRFR